MTDPQSSAAKPVSRVRAALLLLPLALFFGLAAAVFLSRAALRLSPSYFQAVGPSVPSPFSWLGGGDLARSALSIAAWKLALPFCASWIAVSAAGLLDRRMPPLGWRGATGAFALYWALVVGTSWLTMGKTMRFAPRPERLPARYAFLDPNRVGGETYRQAVAVHTGFEIVWASTLVGALGAVVFAGFARARPSARAKAKTEAA